MRVYVDQLRAYIENLRAEADKTKMALTAARTELARRDAAARMPPA